MKVVEKGLKLDLHIHSIYSRGKDHAKVKYNTIENINVLADKLNDEEIQLCAITDHDAFNYEIYKALKAYEEKDTYSIIKVFPGVEFSVEFNGDNEKVVVHVIAIFDDKDENKIAEIENILKGKDGKTLYDAGMEIGNHSYSHAHVNKLSYEQNIDDMKKCNDFAMNN